LDIPYIATPFRLKNNIVTKNHSYHRLHSHRFCSLIMIFIKGHMGLLSRFKVREETRSVEKNTIVNFSNYKKYNNSHSQQSNKKVDVFTIIANNISEKKKSTHNKIVIFFSLTSFLFLVCLVYGLN